MSTGKEYTPKERLQYNPPVRAYRVDDFCRAMGFCRSTFYVLVRQGKIRTVCIGRRRLVPAGEAERLLSCQEG